MADIVNNKADRSQWNFRHQTNTSFIWASKSSPGAWFTVICHTVTVIWFSRTIYHKTII